MRHDRWQKILQSAILQSQQYYIPHLTEITPLKKVLELFKGKPQQFIAHCISEKERTPLSKMLKPSIETVLLVGPEGDFTTDEVNLFTGNGFTGVSLGNHRLRTETAAIAAAAYFNVLNHETN